jgi:hypothetical protein
MTAMLRSQTLSISIACPPSRVSAFVSNPANLPQWAKGLCRSVRQSGADWIVETPDGPMRLQFVAPNEFGVLDHRVITPQGVEVLNPMRVVPNGSGSELLFTLFQLPAMSEEQFAEDAAMVERDLRTLKALLEG